MTGSDSPTGTLCSTVSLTNDEPLFGTATQAKVWYILEHPQVYGAKAVEESDFPEAVKAYLAHLVKTKPGSRIQLIKRDNAPYPKSISFFVGLTFEEQPRIYEFQLSGPGELLAFDFQKITSHPDDYAKHLRAEPLYLVCTNGKRDPCCVKLGFSFYTSLANQEPGNTWQTSHVGGHRFAPNLVCFPHGLFYGRLGDDDVRMVLETYRHGEILLNKYRGRSCFPEPVQAAEYYLRIRTGVNAIPAYSLDSAILLGENRWEVLFMETLQRRIHRLVIVGGPSEFKTLKSCRDLEKSQVMQFHLESYQVVGP